MCAKVKGKARTKARVSGRKPIKAGIQNKGGTGGIFIEKVIKIHNARKNKNG